MTRFTVPRPDSPEPIDNASASQPVDSQQTVVDRPQRNRTPTPRGRLFQDGVRRTKAISAKIRQTKALNAASKGQSGGNGKGKARASAPGNDAFDTDDEDEDEGTDDDDAWIVDSTVVPTSDPRELEEEAGTTFRTQLDDSQFCAELTERLTGLLGEVQKPTRQTLKEVLHFVRRDQEAPMGASQRNPKANSLPEQPLEGGGGCHLDYRSQPSKLSQKRRFVPAPLEPSKRGRLTTSGTPSTVLDHTPSPIPAPEFLARLPPATTAPRSLPRVAVGAGTLNLPARPSTCGRSWPQPAAASVAGSQPLGVRSPSPLPAAFQFEAAAGNTQLENTQTVPEDTQTVPEDTQTVPEDTQTVPEDTLPPATQVPRTASSHSLASHPRASPADHRLPRPPAQSLVPSRHASVPQSSQNVSQLEALSDRFDRNERFRARAQAILRQRRANNGDTGSDDLEMMEEDQVIRAAAENSTRGRPARRKRKAGLNSQPGAPRHAASQAIVLVTARTIAHNPFPNRESGMAMSIEAYDDEFARSFPGRPLIPISPPLAGAICDRIPMGHPETQEEIDHNVKNYEKYREDFHFGSLINRGTHYEHVGLKKAFLSGFFTSRHSPCAVHHEYFNPVPVETFVVLLVMMEACIAEWRTGTLVKEHLNAKEQAAMYEKHLANVEVFAEGAPGRFHAMRAEFYRAGMRKVAPHAHSESGNQATIRLQDVRADTPPPADHDADAP